MAARLRFVSFVVLLSLCVLPAHAQIHGVPASVSSSGFGGNIGRVPGVPASVTSLGPRGYSFSPPVNGPCCFNSFFPGQQFSSLPWNQRPRVDFRSLHRHHHFGPVFTPGYAVPYAYPVAVPVPYGDDQYASDDAEDDYAADTALIQRRHLRAKQQAVADESESFERPAESQSIAEEPIAAQPSTVLIFKDGHQLDVENYAIVGETLFEFSNGLTHKFLLADLDLPATQKANDDRGVEFHAPSSGGQ